MAAGKVLILLGGILTLVSTYFLAFFLVSPGIYAYGTAFIINLGTIFANIDAYAVGMGTDVLVVWVLIIVYIVFLVSGILQLIGLANRVVAIIGSILPLVMGVLMLLITLNVLNMMNYTQLFHAGAISAGILPFNLDLGGVGLGTIILLAGGTLGLVGGIMGTSDF
jgi:hypothetical protein